MNDAQMLAAFLMFAFVGLPLVLVATLAIGKVQDMCSDRTVDREVAFYGRVARMRRWAGVTPD